MLFMWIRSKQTQCYLHRRLLFVGSHIRLYYIKYIFDISRQITKYFIANWRLIYIRLTVRPNIIYLSDQIFLIVNTSS